MFHIYVSGLSIIHYAQNPPAVNKLSSFDASFMLTSHLEYGRHDKNSWIRLNE
jgi:hypothetical protein